MPPFWLSHASPHSYLGVQFFPSTSEWLQGLHRGDQVSEVAGWALTRHTPRKGDIWVSTPTEDARGGGSRLGCLPLAEGLQRPLGAQTDPRSCRGSSRLRLPMQMGRRVAPSGAPLGSTVCVRVGPRNQGRGARRQTHTHTHTPQRKEGEASLHTPGQAPHPETRASHTHDRGGEASSALTTGAGVTPGAGAHTRGRRHTRGRPLTPGAGPSHTGVI